MMERRLVALLRKQGHQVVLPSDVGTAGISDPRHLTYAVQNDLALLTRNHNDFEELHNLIRATKGQHPGILLVLAERKRQRLMTSQAIATAIGKLEAAGVPLASELHVLNQWR